MMTVMIKYTENESVSLVPYGSGINDLGALSVVSFGWSIYFQGRVAYAR